MVNLKNIYSSLENNIRALLEVPENTPVEEIESFLRSYQFKILNKDQPHHIKKEKINVYRIRGPGPEYKGLEDGVAGAGYVLELDVKHKPLA